MTTIIAYDAIHRPHVNVSIDSICIARMSSVHSLATQRTLTLLLTLGVISLYMCRHERIHT